MTQGLTAQVNEKRLSDGSTVFDIFLVETTQYAGCADQSYLRIPCHDEISAHELAGALNRYAGVEFLRR